MCWSPFSTCAKGPLKAPKRRHPCTVSDCRTSASSQSCRRSGSSVRKGVNLGPGTNRKAVCADHHFCATARTCAAALLPAADDVVLLQNVRTRSGCRGCRGCTRWITLEPSAPTVLCPDAVWRIDFPTMARACATLLRQDTHEQGRAHRGHGALTGAGRSRLPPRDLGGRAAAAVTQAAPLALRSRSTHGC